MRSRCPKRAAPHWLVLCLCFCATVPVAAQQQTTTVPTRIISLIPATTEMLFEMGAGDRLIGVSNYDRFPPEVERIPKVGGLLDPNVERILSLRPDLVVMYGTQTDLQQRLEAAHIAVYRYVHRGLPDITQTMRELGRRVGAADMADRAATRIEGELAAIGARVAGRPRPSTLLVFGREPGALRRIEASGGYGFLHDLLELAGGTNLVGEIKRQAVELSTETILARAPDVIIELHYGASIGSNQLDAERQVWNALPSLPAVKNRRVYLLVGDEFVVPGPRIVLAARRLAATLHAEH